MEDQEKENFCQKMRDVSRDVHDLSDHMVNAKLGLALSNDQVWAEGLYVFARIFFYLEDWLDKYKHTLIGDLDLPGLRRRDAFDQDMTHFYGSDWAKKETSQPTQIYLDYLKQLEDKDPYLLVPYFYHLYMGILSGGQLLSKKRSLTQWGKAKDNKAPVGEATTFFNLPVGQLKRDLKKATNLIANEMDEKQKEQMLIESVNVFKLNNDIVKSIEGVDEIFYKKMATFSVAALLLAVMAYFAYQCVWNSYRFKQQS